MREEEWRPVAGHPGYEVSSLGRVRSWNKPGFGTTPRTEPRVLKPTPAKGGYLRVGLSARRTRMVHGLVLEAFVGPRPPGLQCCHGDGDPTNNSLRNLRWDTQGANMADREIHQGSYRGMRNPNSRLTVAEVKEIRRRAGQGETGKGLAAEFGITQAHASHIINRRKWAHV